LWNTIVPTSQLFPAASPVPMKNGIDAAFRFWSSDPESVVSPNWIGSACVGLPSNPSRDQVRDCSTAGGRFQSPLVAGNSAGVQILAETFDEPRDAGALYHYVCSSHRSQMQGKIVVGPEISVAPGNIARTVSRGESASSATLQLSNRRSGTLVYSLSEAASWLALSGCVAPATCTATNETDSIVVDFATAGLAAGVYTASIRVDSPNAFNAPVIVPVDLTVNDFSLAQSIITADDSQAGDQFGFSVSISGDAIAIGARGDDDVAASGGAAYVFRRGGTGFAFEQKLTAASAGPAGLMGHSISLDGDTLLAGSPNVGSGVAHAYVFVRAGQNWVLQDELRTEPGVTFSGFGFSVSVDGDLAAVGAPFDDEFGADVGAVYVFARAGGDWILEQKIAPATRTAGGQFGGSVALSNGKLAVGSPGTNRVHVYERTFSLPNQRFVWPLEVELAFQILGVGASIDLDGDRMVIGVAGATRGFAYHFDGARWSLEDLVEPLAPGAASADFGSGIAIDGDRIAVGDQRADFEAPSSGAAFLFERGGAQWIQRLKFGDNEGRTSDRFGSAISLQGDTIVVGAENEDGIGAVFVFEPPVVFSITDGPAGTPNPVAPERTVALSVSGEDDQGNSANSFEWEAICAGPSIPTTCEHDLCDAGVALDARCDACAASICDADPFCCFGVWGEVCIAEVASICGSPICSGSFSDPTAQQPDWTAPPNPGDEPRICEISVIAGNGFGDSDVGSFELRVEPLPEPTAWSATLAACVGLFALRRRRTATRKIPPIPRAPGNR